MARILSGGGKNSSGNPTTTVVGRPGFGRVVRSFRQSVRRLAISDPADGILNADIRDVPMISLGDRATLTTAMTGSQNDLTLTANEPGDEAEDISFEITDPNAESAPMVVSVTGNDISVAARNDAGDKAVGTLTSDGTNVSNNDTVTIGGRVYTFKTTLTGAADEIHIGADAAATLDNLKAAINAGAGAGTDYGTGTTAHATVTATTNTNTTQVVEAKTAGSGGNAITTTEASTHLSWGGGTLAGGGVNPNIAATAAEVVDAINNDDDASALVTASVKSGETGAGVVTTFTQANLAAGKEGEMRQALPPGLAAPVPSPAVSGREEQAPTAPPLSQTATTRVRNRSANRSLRKR